MKAASTPTLLGSVITRIKDQIEIQHDETYNRLTIRMNGRGIEIRDTIPGFEIGTKKQFVAKAGQLVLSKIDARNGAFGVLPEHCHNAIITGNFWAFDVDTKRLLPQFFDYLTKTPLFLDFCIRASEGTTNRRYLQEEAFLSQEIALPPLGEQRRIVGRIEELAAKMEEAQNLRDRCDQATIAFVASAHAALATSTPEPLSNFVELDEDATPIEFGVPYPQAGVRGFGGGLFAKPPVHGGETTYRAFNRLYRGALVMSQVKGWEGAIAMTPNELEGYFVSPEYRTFRCKANRCLPEYLSALVPTEFFWGRLKDATRGVGARRERTRPEQFLQLEFSMPSLADQKRAIEIFQSVNVIRCLQREVTSVLAAMLPAILDKAFQGEL